MIPPVPPGRMTFASHLSDSPSFGFRTEETATGWAARVQGRAVFSERGLMLTAPAGHVLVATVHPPEGHTWSVMVGVRRRSRPAAENG